MAARIFGLLPQATADTQTDPIATIRHFDRIHRMKHGSVEPIRSRYAGFLVAGVVLLGVAACDTAPGPEAVGLRPPVVSEFTYSPSTIVVDELAPEDTVDGTARVRVGIEVRAIDPDGDLERVSFVIRAPESGSVPVISGDLSAIGDRRFALDEVVAFPRALVGRYTLVVFAVDRSGRLGNEVRGAIDLLAVGTPPVISDIEMPERVTRPSAGEPATPVVIVATVADPDGLANVLRVETYVNGASVPLFLCDDGGSGSCNAGFGPSGDAESGDGRYTLTLVVESGNALGSNTFVFEAVDRSGLRSDPITRTIVIE